MTVYSKYNIVYHLQKWMDSVPGQTFLNYAYSWGRINRYSRYPIQTDSPAGCQHNDVLGYGH